MKYIIIKTCKDCPDSNRRKSCSKYPIIKPHILSEDMEEYKNVKTEIERDIENYPEIPEWCQLEDYQKTLF